MLPNLALIGDLAKALGYEHNWLKRKIREVEASTGAHLLHGHAPLRVDVSQLRQACPELFPVEYNRAASELRAELKRNRRRLARLENQRQEFFDAVYALYEVLSDKIDHQRSPAINPSAMDEGPRIFVPRESVALNPTESANEEPILPRATSNGADAARGISAPANRS